MSQTVGRAISILEFCSTRPRELREIAAALEVHRTTALRTLQTLEAAGFVRKDDQGRYGVGFRLAGLAQAALSQFDLRTVVHPHLVCLSESTGQTIQFAVPQGDRLVYVDKVEPVQAISLNTTIGGYVVTHTAGVSKAILANMEPEPRERILAGVEFERYTKNTITGIDEFRARLDQVKERGWATDDGEYDIISNCIAAAVWDHSGTVAGAISITAFREKADLEALEEFLPELLRTTNDISLELGWRPAA
ncbi:IclR family transcriptional regulator [Microbacterium hydrocarbonoxydans]|uniref:IclR family transcriptional regulator n=1 Tax=Microbacterium hydrocarbonoxydans TaxID=273678 RepID=UPI0007BBFD2A|nr:IclR family transcriptional regulator [Microbacterium hydrocarbonoxydans]GAT74262.1 IclR family transcriptional regulator [Microbacterium sp. HM58-2]